MHDDATAVTIPRWPITSVVLHDDGSGVLTINATDEPVRESDLAAARTAVLERVRAYARDELARPVRLLTTDPDGTRCELAVHPDGDVDEISVGEQPPPAAVRAGPVARAERAAGTRRRRRGWRGGRLTAALTVGVAVSITAFGALRAPQGERPASRAGTTAAPPSSARSAGAEAARPGTRAGADAAATVDRARRAATRRMLARRRAAARAARRRAAARTQRSRVRVARRRAAAATPERRRIAPPPPAPNGGASAAPRAPAAATAPARPARTREPRATPGDLPPAPGGA